MQLLSKEAVLGAVWLAVVLPAVWLPRDKPKDDLAKVVVVYASDSGGFAALINSMSSLARRLRAPSQCVIHLIVPREDLGQVDGLVGCWRRELARVADLPEVVLHGLRPMPLNVSGLWRQRGRSDSSVAANLARNYLHEYLPNEPRALWLDIDTIVQADVAPLFRKPMRHGLAAANEVQNGLFYCHGVAPAHLKSLFTHNLTPWSYFNPGVLLIDLRRWRAELRTRRVEEMIRLTNGWLIDTLALNLVFLDDFDLLDTTWNFQGLSTNTNWSWYKLTLQTAKILHWHRWPGGWKPWDTDKPQEFKVNDHIFRAHDPQQKCDALQ